ncbi:hypothetical protein [Streptomyces collinus]
MTAHLTFLDAGHDPGGQRMCGPLDRGLLGWKERVRTRGEDAAR